MHFYVLNEKQNKLQHKVGKWYFKKAVILSKILVKYFINKLELKTTNYQPSLFIPDHCTEPALFLAIFCSFFFYN